MTGMGMKLPTQLLIPMALLVLTPGAALAQVTRVISLSNIQQSVDTSYRFDASQSQLASSTQHGLQEDYHFTIDYSIYKARLLHGQIALDLQADQNYFSGGGGASRGSYGLGLLYDINGVFLDRFPYPVTFNFSSQLTEVPREFAPSYQQQTDTVSLGVSLASRKLPTAFNYTRSSNETSGLEINRKMKSESFSFGASHSLMRLSDTQLSVIGTSLDLATSDGAENDHSGNLESTLNNTLTFSTSELSRVLYSRARVVNQSGNNESRSMELGESLNWDLGRALTSGADYTLSNREGIKESSQTTNTGRLWLQHRLFKSLTTRLDLNASDNSLATGSDRTVYGGLSLTYQKILPSEGRLQLQGNQQYGVTSSRLSDNTLPVFAEQHTVGPLLLVTLDRPNVDPDSPIEVWNAARTRKYELSDYEVVNNGTVTELIIKVGPLASISPGELLSIDYDYLVNSDITYSSTSRGLGTDLSFLNNKYRMFANWDTSRQDLISGKADQINLTGTDNYRTGVETRFESGSLATEYSRSDSSSDLSQSLSATLLHSGKYGPGAYTLSVADRYVRTESNSLTAKTPRRSTNVVSAGGSYTRVLDNSVVLTTTANYLGTMGFVDSNNLSLSLGLRWNIRRLTITMLTRANLRYASGNLTSDEHLQLRLSRYF